jgi:hypothetical protein
LAPVLSLMFISYELAETLIVTRLVDAPMH